MQPHEHFCASHDSGERLSDSAAAAVAEALERARVVGVLDGWANTAQRNWSVEPSNGRGPTCLLFRGVVATPYHAATPDEARSKAAAAIEAGEV